LQTPEEFQNQPSDIKINEYEYDSSDEEVSVILPVVLIV